jgi:hypothetical protein
LDGSLIEYTAYYAGIKFEPFIRFYRSKNEISSERSYLQLHGLFGLYSGTYNGLIFTQSPGKLTDPALGIGFKLGKRMNLTGKFKFEFNIGLKYYKLMGQEYFNDEGWYLWGPGLLLTSDLLIGIDFKSRSYDKDYNWDF